ncbi:MAG: hypothetical protein D3924_02140 [Candidatus Electrothrix sp. AR4]|nr:hypothetical protein [Candidatus Electrothrix sp. AR4]
MSLLIEYHLYIMLAVFVALFFLPPKHKKKKSIITLMVLLAFSIVYEFAMKEPVTEMPARINRALNQEGPSKSENVKYYKDPAANM